MRLTQEQINGIIAAITPYIKGSQAELRLYGSRVNDQLKGGDIDLLLSTKEINLAADILDNKHYVLSSIKQKIGDQKIDLLITTNSALKTDAFLQMILPTSQVLKKWTKQ